MNTIKTFLMAAAFAFATLPALAEDNGGAMGGDHPMMKRGGWGIEKLDTDGDGNISKAEFMAEGEKKFAELDTNSDGTIGKDEIAARRAAWEAKKKEKHQGEPAPAPENGGTEPPQQ